MQSSLTMQPYLFASLESQSRMLAQVKKSASMLEHKHDRCLRNLNKIDMVALASLTQP